MVLVRKRFFRIHCEETLRNSNALTSSRTKTFFGRNNTTPAAGGSGGQAEKKPSGRKRIGARSVEISRPTNGHVVDDFINERAASPEHYDDPLGRGEDSDKGRDGSTTAGHTPDTEPQRAQSGQPLKSAMTYQGDGNGVIPGQHIQIISEATPSSAQYRTRQMLRERTFTRTLSLQPTTDVERSRSRAPVHDYASPLIRGATLTRAPTATHRPHPHTNMNTGYGGFDYPPYIVRWLLPKSWKESIMRRISTRKNNLTIFTHPTLAPERITQGGRLVMPGQGINGENPNDLSLGQSVRARVAQWMPDSLEGLVVGRNSRFYTEELDEEAIEQLGGVEYKALRLLAWLIPGVSAPFCHCMG